MQIIDSEWMEWTRSKAILFSKDLTGETWDRQKLRSYLILLVMMTANVSINSKKKNLFMPQSKEVDKKAIERKDKEKI